MHLLGAIDATEARPTIALTAHTLTTVSAGWVAHCSLVKLAVALATKPTASALAGSTVAIAMAKAIVGTQCISALGSKEAVRTDARASVALSVWSFATLRTLRCNIARKATET